MRTLESFFIGVILGFLLAMCVVTLKGPVEPYTQTLVVSDTVRTACCDEYLDHIAREH